MRKVIGVNISVMMSLVLIFAVAGCSDESDFTSQATTETFVQDFNPENVDVLWVIDDRSPMYRAKNHLVTEATKFFQRIDAIPRDYQMAFVSADMQFAAGRLKPEGSAVILRKNRGTLEERTALFSNILGQIINLHTGAMSQGLVAALAAIRNKHFESRPGVTLILIFVSDSDDKSPALTGSSDVVRSYADAFIGLKGGQRDLVRAFSLNYVSPASGQAIAEQDRCATRYNADIDSLGFENRYSRFAGIFQTVPNQQVTGNLCRSFSDTIDLSGLKLKEPRLRFRLKATANTSSINVTVTRNSENVTLPWRFDKDSNEVVFESAPPEGAVIQVTYQAG